MFSNEYGEAAVEVLDILNNTNIDDVKKIPSSFIEFLKENASKSYRVNFDHSRPINELNIKKKTKEILGVIYINWWCDKEKKEEYKNQILEYKKIKEDELREKYNPNLFKDTRIRNDFSEVHKNRISKNEELVIVKSKENIFKQILNKIIKFFKG